jgi:two-component system response regulator FixJ
MPDLTVHVVDDDLAIRESLDFLLGTAGFEVRLHENAQSLLDTMPGPLTGCILTDIRMPGIDGIELLRRVQARERKLPVVVMTGHGDVPLAVEAMKLGASDFIEKPFDDAVLLSAIRNACERVENDLDPTVATFMKRLATLTGRERQVFDRMVTGQATKVIARDLDLSPRTVEVYRANVMGKMEAGSVSELVRLAVKTGVT